MLYSILTFLLAVAPVPIINVDCAQMRPPLEINQKGSFSGVLPFGVTPDYPNWSTSIATAGKMTEDGKVFIRFNVKKADANVLFRLSDKKLAVPGYYRLEVYYRCHGQPINFHIRQYGKPYKNFWDSDTGTVNGWIRQVFFISLAPTLESAHLNIKLDSSNVVLYMFLRQGFSDLGEVRLTSISRQEYENGLQSRIKRPSADSSNYFGNHHFPLGLPCGWNFDRYNLSGTAEADSTMPGPSGCPSLKIVAPQPVTLYSVPFQTGAPDRPVTVSFQARGEGKWQAECGGKKIPIVPSSRWQLQTLTFQPDPLAVGFHLKLIGYGKLYLDDLSAVSGGPSDRQVNRREDAEISLAPAASGIAATRIQFTDEPARVAYYATGKLSGLSLCGNVINIYGETRPLPRVGLASNPQGTLDYGVFAERPLGQFRVEVWAERGKQRVSPITELVMTRIRRPLYWGKDAPASPFGGHFYANPRDIATMKAAGMNWVRCHDVSADIIYWGLLEKEKGKWSFQDEKVARYRDGHLKILGGIGTAPTWASYFSGIKSPHYFDLYYQPKDMKAFRNYVRTVVSHYKGRIDEYHFENEPWHESFWHKDYNPKTGKFGQGETPAQDYVKLSKIAYAELKQANPGAIMYGFNSASGTIGMKWTEATFTAGMYDYCDAIDYHFYNTGNQLCGYPGDAVENAWQSAVGYILARVPAPMKPVIMTEGNASRSGITPLNGGPDKFTGLLNYSYSGHPEPDPAAFADSLCRFVVSHLRLGVKRIFLYSDHCYHHMLRPPSFPVLLGADGYPHPTLAAFSNMAWLLEDRKFVESVPVGENVWAFIFTGRGASVAVISGHRSGKFVVSESPDIKGIDLLGNPLPQGAKYEGRLFYLVSGMSAVDLAKQLQSKVGRK